MKKSDTPEQGAGTTALYVPTPEERAAIEVFLAKRKAQPPAPRLKVTENGDAIDVRLDHPALEVGTGLLMQALGITSIEFFNGLLAQLVNATTPGGKADERGANFMLSAMKAVAPRDEIEAMLAAQMAAVHVATMTFARRLANVESIQQQDSAERAFNKLARTFAVQIEALRRYRTGGEQRVTVQHVTVNEGGQAIVGNVAARPAGGGDQRKMETTP